MPHIRGENLEGSQNPVIVVIVVIVDLPLAFPLQYHLGPLGHYNYDDYDGLLGWGWKSGGKPKPRHSCHSCHS